MPNLFVQIFLKRYSVVAKQLCTFTTPCRQVCRGATRWTKLLSTKKKKRLKINRFAFVVDRGFEPLCPAWEAGILALRWIHHCCIASAKVGKIFYSPNFSAKNLQNSAFFLKKTIKNHTTTASMCFEWPIFTSHKRHYRITLFTISPQKNSTLATQLSFFLLPL